MSKNIFVSNDVYTPVTVPTWNNVFGQTPTATVNLTFQQQDTADNAVTFPVQFTQIGPNFIVASLKSSVLTYDATIIHTGSNYPYKSTTPVPDGCFNAEKALTIGVTCGAVINNSNALTRPCNFVFYIDHQGYMYYYQSYTAGNTATNIWSSGWSTTYHYLPSAQTTGDTNSNAIVDMLITDATFCYSVV